MHAIKERVVVAYRRNNARGRTVNECALISLCVKSRWNSILRKCMAPIGTMICCVKVDVQLAVLKKIDVVRSSGTTLDLGTYGRLSIVPITTGRPQESRQHRNRISSCQSGDKYLVLRYIKT
jgi:hypothetical protein